MAVYFFDGSAIFKRYIYEPGSQWVRAVVESNPTQTVFVSQLAQVEVIAALRRVGRLNGWDKAYIDSASNIFRRHLALSVSTRRTRVYRIVPLSESVLTLAAELCDTYADLNPFPLRSLDAIQLSCALTARVGLGPLADGLVLVTADVRLGAVAAHLGINVQNPERA